MTTSFNPETPIPSSSSPTDPAAPMQVIPVPIDRIQIVPDRDHRGENVDLKDLLESIPIIGMLHALLMLPERDGKYELLAGNRSSCEGLDCSKVAGLARSPSPATPYPTGGP